MPYCGRDYITYVMHYTFENYGKASNPKDIGIGLLLLLSSIDLLERKISKLRELISN